MRHNDPRSRSASTQHDIRRLRKKLYEALHYMAKCDRPIYGRALIEYGTMTQMWFIRSYKERDAEAKYKAAVNAAMWFSVLREDIEEDLECNIIKYPKRKPKSDIPALAAAEEVNGQKMELVELIAKIDEGIGRWCSSLSQGQVCVRSAPGDIGSPMQGCGS